MSTSIPCRCCPGFVRMTVAALGGSCQVFVQLLLRSAMDRIGELARRTGDEPWICCAPGSAATACCAPNAPRAASVSTDDEDAARVERMRTGPPRPGRGRGRPRGSWCHRAQRGCCCRRCSRSTANGPTTSWTTCLAPDGRGCAPELDPAGAARDRRTLGARRGIGRAGALREQPVARPPARARVALGSGRRAARAPGVRAGRPPRPPARHVRPCVAGTGMEDPLPRRRHAVGGVSQPPRPPSAPIWSCCEPRLREPAPPSRSSLRSRRPPAARSCGPLARPSTCPRFGLEGDAVELAASLDATVNRA